MKYSSTKSILVYLFIIAYIFTPIKPVEGAEITAETDKEDTIYLDVDWRPGGGGDWEVDDETYEDTKYLYHFLGTAEKEIKEIIFKPAKTEEVRRVIWPRRNWVKEVPENIEKLGEDLNRLDLRENKLEGEIPGDRLGKLSRLVWLRLDHNKFEGEIPGDMFEKFERLKVLDLQQNELEGEIPEKLGTESPDLERILLHNNKLEEFADGDLEDFFETLENLEVFTLKNNKLSELPSEIALLKNLQELNVRGNKLKKLFSGWGDSDEMKLKELEQLRADHNFLGCEDGTNPEEILPYAIWEGEEGLESLRELDDLYTRHHKQWIPRELKLDLRYNCIEEVPESIGELQALEAIHLDKNRLEGFFDDGGESLDKLPKVLKKLSEYDGNPSEIDDASKASEILNFRIFSAGDNKLEGTIPEEIPDGWENIEIIRLENNLLEGDIPEEMFKLDELEVLNIESNLFGQGDDAEGVFGGDSSMDSLRELYAGRNYFEKVKDGFEAPELRHFQLEENEIEELGSGFGSGFDELKVLSLFKNKLEKLSDSFGEMSSLEFVDLGTNQIHDQFPESLTELDSLKYLNVGRQTEGKWKRKELHGQIEGDIPDNLTELSDLETLLFNNNKLEKLPKSGWGSMGELAYIYGQNNELENLPKEMGDLESLKKLYLNNNQIEEKIPDNLTNTSELKRFYIQYNNENNKDRNPGGVTGELPKNNSWDNLKRFFADSNEIEGGLHDKFVKNLEDIEYLSLYRNQMDGEISNKIDTMEELVWWDIGLNEDRGQGGLTGEIPKEVKGLKDLTVFDFNNNKLTKVPDEINQLDKLISLLGFENCISDFAKKVGNLTQLRHMDFHNAVVGNAVPEWPKKIETLDKLVYISFGENESVSGEVKWDKWDISNKNALFLNNNKLKGDIPDDLHSQSRGMVFLNLRTNEFKGGYPTQ